MMLTQLKITSAKPKAKPYNLADGQGLVLIVQTNGSKLWRFRYRYGWVQKTHGLINMDAAPGVLTESARVKGTVYSRVLRLASVEAWARGWAERQAWS